MKREDLRDQFQWMPRWMLIVFQLSVLPVYIIIGGLCGAADFLLDWKNCLSDLWIIDEVEDVEESDSF